MIDTHCHLAGEEFAGDLDAVVARAHEAGVQDAVCVLAAEEDAEVARAAVVRAAWPSIQFATGIHPHHAGQFAGDMPRAIETVRRAVEACGACAIGEIGLDYYYDFSPRPVQQEVFRAQIRLAGELGLPIVIHTREATADTLRLIREEGGGLRGVFHCFTGDRETAGEALELGFHLSYAGILTFPNAEALREAARVTPLERLLSETDAPYLAPVPHRGKRNEPAYVAKVVEALAGLHGVSTDVMAAQIRANAEGLFRGRGPVPL